MDETWSQMGGHMGVVTTQDVVPANKPWKRNTHQQDFLVFAVKSLSSPDLIYLHQEQVIGKNETVEFSTCLNSFHQWFNSQL